MTETCTTTVCVENADLDTSCPVTDTQLAVETSIPEDARQDDQIREWESRKKASTMSASKEERWILWLIRAAKVHASKAFVENICPVCGARRKFYTVDDAYSHVIGSPVCWPAIYSTEEEKFNEEEKLREAQ